MQINRSLYSILKVYLLEEALDSGNFKVGDVKEVGDVNIIVLTNITGESVFIIYGEGLGGAKQKQMFSTPQSLDLAQIQFLSVPTKPGLFCIYVSSVLATDSDPNP